MVELGYYSNRLDELEKRKEKLQGTIVTAKLSLNGVEREIEACKEQIDNLTTVMDDKADKKDKIIKTLENEIEELKEVNNSLKKENTQLKHDVQELKLDLRIEKRKVDKLESQSESELHKKIDQLRDERLDLKKKNAQLKKELEQLKNEFSDRELDKIMNMESDDDTILSENFGKDNIFEKLHHNS